ncbi:MAG: TolC family protein [Alphaproteobacteria bacterium]|nr:TolC family protein [Alphaproteobacteria bacterium]MDE2493890.1 TolC family protein [Alphaproteobacteria bacterium]
MPVQAAQHGAPEHMLDMTQVAIEAVQRSPNLVALRRKSDVSEAQALAAGLLPDPQFSASGDHPTVHGADLVNAYALGLSEDLQTLLTYPSRSSAAKAAADQAKLDLLWNEWQTIEQAGALYAQKIFSDQKAKQLTDTATKLLLQADHSERALSTGDTTIDLAGADLSTALDLASQADTASRDALTADIGLKSLLDLKPDAALQLAALGDPQPLTRDGVSKALANVTKARPDLLALQAGYQSQEENVRTAILQQFPAITFGFNRASDTSRIQTSGLALTVNLPIFGSTQANIKVQRATRAQLKAEYMARLDQTTSDAWRLFEEISLLRAQAARLEEKLPAFERMAQTSQKAYTAGDLSPATYAILQTSLSAREAELFDLKSQLWSDTLALRTILAIPAILPTPTAETK